MKTRPAPKLTGKDLLLLFLYAPNTSGEMAEAIRGRTRLTKMLFVFGEEIYREFRFDKEIDPAKMPSFYAWHYGPFSKDVFSDIDFFIHIGFIQASASPDGEGLIAEAAEYSSWESDLEIGEPTVHEYTEEAIGLTDTGVGYIEKMGLWDRLSDRQKEALSEFKSRFADAPLYSVLKYVYDKYPNYTEKSVIRDKFLH